MNLLKKKLNNKQKMMIEKNKKLADYHYRKDLCNRK